MSSAGKTVETSSNRTRAVNRSSPSVFCICGICGSKRVCTASLPGRSAPLWFPVGMRRRYFRVSPLSRWTGPGDNVAEIRQVMPSPFPLIVPENRIHERPMGTAEFLRVEPADPPIIILHALHVLGKNNANQFIDQGLRALVEESRQVCRLPAVPGSPSSPGL